MHRALFDFKRKKIDQISSYDLIAITLSLLILKKIMKSTLTILIHN